jgi:hypothetical protein
MDGSGSRSGFQHTGADLQKSALARSILTNNAERFAPLHFEADVAERPIIGMKTTLVERHQFLEAVAWCGIYRVTLGDTRKFDSGTGHYREL